MAVPRHGVNDLLHRMLDTAWQSASASFSTLTKGHQTRLQVITNNRPLPANFRSLFKILTALLSGQIRIIGFPFVFVNRRFGAVLVSERKWKTVKSQSLKASGAFRQRL